MIDYTNGFSVRTLVRFVSEETLHSGTAEQAAKMWAAAVTYLDESDKRITNRRTELEKVWTDGAFRLFRDEQLEPNREQLAAFVAKIKEHKVQENLAAIPGLITNTVRKTQEAVRGYNHVIELGKEPTEQQERETARQVGMVLNELAEAYDRARTSIERIGDWQWHGPRAALPVSHQSSENPQTAGTPGPADISPTEPGQVPDPASPASPTETKDPLKSALQEAPGALDALSQATQSLQHLLGGGQGVPNPVSLPDSASFDPAALPFRSPIERAEYLNGLAGAGSPSLAGSGGAGGLGPVGGGMGTGSSAVSQPLNATTGTGGAPLSSGAASGAASTAGFTGAASSGSGMAPPPASPNQAGKKADTGIKPGTAEDSATGRPRERKRRATPGVALLGRSGSTARPGTADGAVARPTPLARRRRDAGNDTVQLLDEELWRVEQHDTTPKNRFGH